MKFVILTGMSGAGKSTALKMMEDMGFYCVDNLPIPLLEKFVELSELFCSGFSFRASDTALMAKSIPDFHSAASADPSAPSFRRHFLQ